MSFGSVRGFGGPEYTLLVTLLLKKAKNPPPPLDIADPYVTQWPSSVD